MKNLFLIWAILSCQTVAFTQGWQKILADTIRPVTATNAYDGGYVMAGYVGRSAFHGIMKVDAKGNRQWVKNLTDFTPNPSPTEFPLTLVRTVDSAFLLHGSDQDDNFMLKKIDQQGNTVWSKKLPLDYARLKTNKNEYILIGKSRTLSTYVLLRLNLSGDTISQKIVQSGRFSDFEVQNDGIIATEYFNASILKINFEGQVLWQKTLTDTVLYARLIKTKDSSYYAGNNDKRLFKIAKDGSVSWKKAYNYYDYALTNEGGVIGVIAPTEQINGAIQSYLRIGKIDKTGNSIWTKRIDPDPRVQLGTIISCTGGGYLVVANTYSASGFPIPLLIKMDDNGLVYPVSIEGKIIKDMDKNCRESAGDRPFSECLVEAKNDVIGDISYAFSDANGRYALNIDTGRYTIKVYPRYNRNFWQSCTPSVSKTFSSANRTDSIDFLLNTLVDCPSMDIHITTPILRRCFNNTYTVKYCNKGTLKADNAYITVTIDSLLEFINASKPVISQTGRTYRFNLGTIAVDDCGSFDITARVRCGDSTRLSQALCVEAKVFPDTICPPLTLWSGANMVVTGACQGDSVVFQIKNTGTAPSSSLNSIMIEDEVLFLRQPVQLPQNGVFTKKLPANGHTWRMAVNQELNHPNSTNSTAFVEGCRANNNLPFSTGYALLFPTDDSGLTIDMDCHPIVGAYDPNDKMGYPLGYKTAHFVAQNQDIEYLIRFQNTGTDTAFTVVIRDTISPNLAISSLEFGASSHPYEAEIYGKGILKFTFNAIKLVDSFRNEAKSHGFVQYRIKQQKDLAFGIQIFNTAYIYFDFNEPIVTNKTTHTVGGKDIILAIMDKNATTNTPIKVTPNPFTTTTTFETPLPINGDFELYDIVGKLLRKERFDGKIFEFQRKDLTAGVYIFKIMVEGRPLSIGKLMVQ